MGYIVVSVCCNSCLCDYCSLLDKYTRNIASFKCMDLCIPSPKSMHHACMLKMLSRWACIGTHAGEATVFLNLLLPIILDRIVASKVTSRFVECWVLNTAARWQMVTVSHW